MAKQRKEKFLETALKLFAEKGYHTTSIQDIVEAWGISKGAFYHHFSSKEELMLEIVRYHFEKLMASFMETEPEAQFARETFVHQLTMKLEGILKHKDFFQMMMVEQLPKINADIQRYLFTQRARMFHWYCQRLVDIYGEKVEKYVFDIAAIVNGIFREYLFYMMFHPKLRADAVARFIVRQIDAIVERLGEEEPLLNKEAIRCFTEIAEQEQQERKAKILAELARLKKQLFELPIDKKTHHQLHAAVDTLEAEFSNDQTAPREYVVKGILLYIESQQIQPLSDAIASLTKLVNKYVENR